MKHYFLTGLNDKQKVQLADSLVVFSDMVIGDQNGLLFDETNKNFALQVLGFVEKKQAATVYDGIIQVVYGPAEATATEGDKSTAGPSKKTDVVKAKRPELDAEHQKYRELYIAACSSRVSELVVQNRQVLSTERSQIERLQHELVRELRAIRIEEGRAHGAPLIDRETYAREFDAIFDVPKVKDVSVEDGVISVYTETLFAYDNRSRKNHELGAYVIQFFTDGQADCVRWYNQTRRVHAGRSDQHAPHVYTSGRSSLHAIKDSIVDLVAELQFAVATQLAIDFIEQVDVDEPDGAHLDRWPLEKQPEPEPVATPADSTGNSVDGAAGATTSDGAANAAANSGATNEGAAGDGNSGTSGTGPR
jgi:HPt (histidine-containing phosphotransfer) domain-containing protein